MMMFLTGKLFKIIVDNIRKYTNIVVRKLATIFFKIN